MKKKTENPIRIPSARSEDQPATRKMLDLVKRELSQKISSESSRLEGKIDELRGEFGGLRGEFSGLRGEFGGLRAEFGEFNGSITRMELMFEEQNANNRIVLEGLQLLWQRQERHELERH